MKHLQIGFLSIFLTFFFSMQGQQNHFIYLQTENKQPFYVKLNKTLFSSSASGYLVLAKLKQGAYDLTIGFPKNEWPELNIPCTISNKDLGYLVKNFGEKGWGLFNLQSLDIVMAGSEKPSKPVVVETKTDEFSNLLSNVVNDPTIKQVEPVKDPTPALDSQKTAVTTASDAANDVAGTQAQVDGIKKTFLSRNSDGTEMVFTDKFGGKTDTVRLYIPFENSNKKNRLDNNQAEEKSVEQTNNVSEQKVDSVVASTDDKTNDDLQTGTRKKEKKNKRREKKFIELEVPDTTGLIKNPIAETNNLEKVTLNTAEKESSSVKMEAVSVDSTSTSTSAMINSDCKKIATEDDFIKLRKKMVGEDNDDDMVALAKKSFKTKCFSVEQVKNLSALFLKDSGRYAFYDMAYPFVSDSHNFSVLQNQLTDPYYINRFQVMIRK